MSFNLISNLTFMLVIHETPIQNLKDLNNLYLFNGEIAIILVLIIFIKTDFPSDQV